MNAKTATPLLAVLVLAVVGYLRLRRVTISAAPGGAAAEPNTGAG